jgi:hypothetical protein
VSSQATFGRPRSSSRALIRLRAISSRCRRAVRPEQLHAGEIMGRHGPACVTPKQANTVYGALIQRTSDTLVHESRNKDAFR